MNELVQEAMKRGLVLPEATDLLGEAKTRGIINIPWDMGKSTPPTLTSPTEPPAAPVKPPFDEWYAGKAKLTGIDPNPDDPLHKYDYKAAYEAGAEPSVSDEDGKYHWPSMFKADDHPNRYVNGVDTKTGEFVNKGAQFQSEGFEKNVQGVSEVQATNKLNKHLPGITKEGTQDLYKRIQDFSDTNVLEKTDTGFKVNPKSTEYLGPMLGMAQPLKMVVGTPWWVKGGAKGAGKPIAAAPKGLPEGQTVDAEFMVMADKPMSGEFALQRLKDSGVAKAEIEMTGLDTFVKSKKTVTPKQIADFAEQNKVEVVSIVKDDTYKPRTNFLDNPTQETLQKETKGTKFSSHQTPGGENYKETLLTLPVTPIIESPVITDLRNKVSKYNVMQNETFSGYAIYDENLKQVSPTFQSLVEANDRFREIREDIPAKPSPGFTGGHWDEPNVIAHIRSNERTLPNGEKVYHIEEFQSDWNTAASPQKENDYRFSPKPVDKNPLVDNWQDLSVRKALKDAVDSGADRITWVTGQQTAHRYDLSRHLESINYVKEEDGSFSLGALSKGSDDWGELADHISVDELPSYVGKDIANKIIKGDGKLDHQNDMGGISKTISNLDLKVGGEWTTKLYDESIVNRFNKLGRKWGSKVEDTNLSEHETGRYELIKPDGEVYGDGPASVVPEWKRDHPGWIIRGKIDPGDTVHSLPLTPEMKADIKRQEFHPFGDFEAIPKEKPKYTVVKKGVSEDILKKEAEQLGLDRFGYMDDLDGHPIYTARDAKTGSNIAPMAGETLEDARGRVWKRFGLDSKGNPVTSGDMKAGPGAQTRKPEVESIPLTTLEKKALTALLTRFKHSPSFERGMASKHLRDVLKSEERVNVDNSEKLGQIKKEVSELESGPKYRELAIKHQRSQPLTEEEQLQWSTYLRKAADLRDEYAKFNKEILPIQSLILRSLSKKGILLPEKAMPQNRMNPNAEYKWGFHPEVRKAFGKDPLGKEDSIRTWIEGRDNRYEDFTVTSPETGSGYYIVPSKGLVTIARNLGYSGKMDEIIEELKSTGVIKEQPATPGRWYGRTSDTTELIYERTWDKEITEYKGSHLYQDLFKKMDKISNSDARIETALSRLVHEQGEITPEKIQRDVLKSAVYSKMVTSKAEKGNPLRNAPPRLIDDTVIKQLINEYISRGQSPELLNKYDRATERVRERQERRMMELEQYRKEEEMAKKSAGERYKTKPEAVSPVMDVFHRLTTIADENGVIDYAQAKKQMPSEFTRFSKELGEMFNFKPTITVSQMMEKQYNFQKEKYHYDLVKNTKDPYPEYALFKNDPVHYLQIWGDPEKVKWRGGHSFPASEQSGQIPTIGWLAIKEHEGTWILEEVQSDILAKYRKSVVDQRARVKGEPAEREDDPYLSDPQTAHMKLEKLEADYKELSDWADYGFSTLLSEARKQGIKAVLIPNPKVIVDLWGGNLGEAKSTIYYKDFPKKFGFKLDHIEMKTGNRKVPSGKFSHRIPIFIAVAGAGKLAEDMLDKSEE